LKSKWKSGREEIGHGHQNANQNGNGVNWNGEKKCWLWKDDGYGKIVI
jgi:hypothetical protein